MKSAVLTDLNQIEIRDVPNPEIVSDTDVLLKIASVGVCGSDIHYYRTGRIGSQVVEYPFAVGHECSAIIEAVGAAVTTLKPGDRVAVEPAMSCGKCDQCLTGRANTCRELRFLGCPGQAEGCLSEYIVMPEQCCFPIPSEMTLEEAALIEPFAIGYYAVQQLISLNRGLIAPHPDPLPKGERELSGASIGILGCGPIGLSVLFAARAAGADKIYVTDKIDARLAAASRAGACWTGNPVNENVVEGISGKEPLLLNAVFECCGEQDALDQAVDLLKPGGKLMLAGIPTIDRIEFSPEEIRRKEICLQNVRRQNECVQPSIELASGGSCDISGMITHRFTFDQTKDAFDLVAGYEDGVVKAMINFS